MRKLKELSEHFFPPRFPSGGDRQVHRFDEWLGNANTRTQDVQFHERTTYVRSCHEPRQ